MSIRQGTFRFGEPVTITGSFASAESGSITPASALITIKKPSGDIVTYTATPSDGQVSVEVLGDVVGTWHIRLETTVAPIAITESKFEVVQSTVLTPQVISTVVSPVLFTAGVSSV